MWFDILEDCSPDLSPPSFDEISMSKWLQSALRWPDSADTNAVYLAETFLYTFRLMVLRYKNWEDRGISDWDSALQAWRSQLPASWLDPSSRTLQQCRSVIELNILASLVDLRTGPRAGRESPAKYDAVCR